MDPSGYCHRKLGGAQTLLLPPFSFRRFGRRTALPTSFERLRFGIASSASSFGLRTLKTAQVGLSPVRPRPLPIRTFSHKLFGGFVLSFCFESSASPFGSGFLLLHSPLFSLHSFQDQALDRLVSPSSIRYRTSTDDLSTLSSSRGLTCF